MFEDMTRDQLMVAIQGMQLVIDRAREGEPTDAKDREARTAARLQNAMAAEVTRR